MYVPPIYYDHYTVIHRKTDLLRTSPSPRIIIVGGSNVSLGISAKQLSEEFHRPAINMGLNGGIGLRLMLQQIKPYIQPGDIILVSPEYEQFFSNTFNGQGTALVQLVYHSPRTLWYLDSPYQYAEIIKYLPVFLQHRMAFLFKYYIQSKQNVMIGNNQYKTDFNANGDAVFHYNLPSPGFVVKYWKIMNDYDTKPVSYMNRFKQYTDSKHAKIYFLFPGYAKSEYEKNDTKIQLLYRYMEKQSKVEILGLPQDFVYPDDYFFDTVYHLKKAGITQRTQQVSQLLKEKNIQ
jgi:hypothetical protein